MGPPMDGAVARKPVQHFLMSVVRLKTFFLGEIERRKTASDHPTARNSERLQYTPPPQQLTLNGRLYGGLPPFLCPGDGVFSECPTHILGTASEPFKCAGVKDQRGELKFWEKTTI
ncbi:hypothetical protein TNIN_136331 [Trichonephila inaurata madagascariensis]|uniref:Uncharacterized protein n=1 Tax=Trichonephila inaurata madagascariensis TaxID=2747483 RepID=A0A8X6JGR3_9ARAC|nr:hypothetical protein TNIN_136331 [Trichonephila inaurata madagascariensis]